MTSYRQRAYNLKKTMGRFMSGDEVDRFQLLQSETGTVISGSVALQYLGRYDFTASDLDIYTEHRYAEQVCDFLVGLGYHYQPRTNQHLSFTAQLTRDEVQGAHLGGFMMPGAYSSNSMCGAYNFVKPNNDDVVIQLITARIAVMDIILDFHSTVVMNVITHRNAYSLYPYETFEERRALTARKTPARREQVAFAKYRERGWRIRSSVNASEAFDPTQEFSEGTRRVGDEMTWVLPLDQTGRHGALAIDTLPGNSWYLIYLERFLSDSGREMRSYAKMMRQRVVLEGDEWRQAYTFATDAHYTAFRAEIQRIQPDESRQTDADVVCAVEASYRKIIVTNEDDESDDDFSVILQAVSDYERHIFRRYSNVDEAE